MDFLNKNFSGVLSILIYGVIFIAAAALFMNLLPFIAVAGLGIWLFVKGRRMFKAWTKKEKVSTQYAESKSDNIYESNIEFDESKVIDVDYTEVK